MSDDGQRMQEAVTRLQFIVIAYIDCEGMKAANAAKLINVESPVYTESDFARISMSLREQCARGY